MNSSEIRQKVDQFSWYHNINLGYGIVTPGRNLNDLWNMIRECRNHLDYSGKTVLDLGSWDGMWAFEAETLGASTVVATDTHYNGYRNFLFCREVLGSQVVPFYNCSIYHLRESLQQFIFEHSAPSDNLEDHLFDIVQNLGLLYHVRDVMYAIAQTRSVLKTGGKALIETAVILDDEKSYMVLNGYPDNKRIYDDPSTWWAMTIPCLYEMLGANLLKPIEFAQKTLYQYNPDGRSIGRVALVAEAVAPTGHMHPGILAEATKPYRTPGLNLLHLGKV
jgi:tRNA (mo5U34)-methyltransferase